MERRKYLGQANEYFIKDFTSQIIRVDEDELCAARDNGNISQAEFDMAYNVLNRLIDDKIISVDYMERFCARLLERYYLGGI